MRYRRTIPPAIKGTLSAVLCGALTIQAPAQGLYNASSLHIRGAEVYVDGAVYNTGTLTNNGHLAVSADWDSKGRYDGGGLLVLNGNSPQRIFHYGQDVARLLISGWGVKFIKGEFSVAREFHLQRGVVEVTSPDVLKLNNGARVIGGHSESYVDGPVTVDGTGYKFFPIGKNGMYAPIELLDVNGESPEFSMEVFENAPAISVDGAIVRHGLYWHRKDIRGKFRGSAVAVDFEQNYFENPLNTILVAGEAWDQPFQIIAGVAYSTETNKISSHADIRQSILMLGEISARWTAADFYFPTALSPNAFFAENRRVKVFGERLAHDGFRFQVFNRWGGSVYESTSLQHMSGAGWDGRSANGVALPAGTYPYHLHAYDKSGNKFEKKGVITLIY